MPFTTALKHDLVDGAAAEVLSSNAAAPHAMLLLLTLPPLPGLCSHLCGLVVVLQLAVLRLQLIMRGLEAMQHAARLRNIRLQLWNALLVGITHLRATDKQT